MSTHVIPLAELATIHRAARNRMPRASSVVARLARVNARAFLDDFPSVRAVPVPDAEQIGVETDAIVVEPAPRDALDALQRLRTNCRTATEHDLLTPEDHVLADAVATAIQPVHIEWWSATKPHGSDHVPPEALGVGLCGDVTGHPRLPNDARVVTNALAEVRGLEVRTTSGTWYQLGKPHPKFIDWCRMRGRPLDLAHPFKSLDPRYPL